MPETGKVTIFELISIFMIQKPSDRRYSARSLQSYISVSGAKREPLTEIIIDFH